MKQVSGQKTDATPDGKDGGVIFLPSQVCSIAYAETFSLLPAAVKRVSGFKFQVSGKKYSYNGGR